MLTIEKYLWSNWIEGKEGEYSRVRKKLVYFLSTLFYSPPLPLLPAPLIQMGPYIYIYIYIVTKSRVTLQTKIFTTAKLISLYWF